MTAVCAYNDEQAFALLTGMRALGLSAPGDLVVVGVGVDNVPLAPFAAPPLTTVDIGVPQIAAAMSRALLAMVAGEPAPSDAGMMPGLLRRRSA